MSSGLLPGLLSETVRLCENPVLFPNAEQHDEFSKVARACLTVLEETVQQAETDREEEQREKMGNFARLWDRVRGHKHNPARPWDAFLGQPQKLLFNGGYNIWKLWDDETTGLSQLLGVSFGMLVGTK
jgi:hypothetical protein